MQLPIVDFYTPDGEVKTTEDVFLGKKTVLFFTVAAFSQTDGKMLSGYEAAYDDIIAKGVDQVLCYIVNDGLVADAWASSRGVDNVKMLPDGNGAFADALQLLVNRHNYGQGGRAWRTVMILNDEGDLVGSLIEDGMRNLPSTDDYKATTPKKLLEMLDEVEAKYGAQAQLEAAVAEEERDMGSATEGVRAVDLIGKL